MWQEVEQTGDIQVRGATEGDVEQLCRLYEEFHEFHVRGVPGRLVSLRGSAPEQRERLAARIRELMGAKDSAILVAEQEGRVAGLAEVHVREDEPVPARVARRFGYLQSLAVAQGNRQAGVGRCLLKAAEVWARKRDAVEMRLDTWEFPGGPLGFYERCGYRTLRRMMIRELR